MSGPVSRPYDARREIFQFLRDLAFVGTDVALIGQYVVKAGSAESADFAQHESG